MKLVLMRALIALFTQVLWSCTGVESFEISLSLKHRVSNSFGEGLWQDTFLTVVAALRPHFLALMLVLICSRYLRCSGCFSTAQKPLLYLVLIPSAQGSKWAGNWSNLRINCTPRYNLLPPWSVGRVWTHPELNLNVSECWSLVLCQKSWLQVPSLATAAWKARCQPWGMLAFQPSLHHGKNRNKGNLGGKGNVNNNNNNNKPRKNQAQFKSVHRFLFAIPGIWVSWHLSQARQWDSCSLSSRAGAGTGNPGFWYCVWLAWPWAFLKGLIYECTDVPIEVLTVLLLQAPLSEEGKSVMENWGTPCNRMFRLIDCKWALLWQIL